MKTTKISSVLDTLSTSGSEPLSFVFRNSDEICSGQRSTIGKQENYNDSNIFDDEVVAVINKLIENNCINKDQHKVFSIKWNLILLFKLSE